MKRPLQLPEPRRHLLFAASAVSLIAVTYGMARLGYGLFLPAFSASFPLPPAVSGLLAAGASVLYCVSAGIGFRFARSRPRAVTLLAGLSAALGSMGIAGAQTTTVFAAGVLLAGTGAGFASPALVELVQRNTAPEGRGRLQSVVNSGTGFGVVLAGALSLVLGEAWRLAWVLVAVLAATSMLAVLRLDGSATAPAAPLRPAPSLAPRSSMRGLARPLCGAFTFGIGCAAVWVYGRSTLEQSGGMSEGLSAGAWIALGLGGAGATLASRWLADRSIPAAWSLTTLATAAATALLGTAPGSLLLAYAAAALFGLAYTAATSVLILWASTSGTGSAAGTSALFTSLVLGQAAGAPLTGFLLQSGDATLAFPVAALACAVSAAAVAPVGARVRLRWQWCRGRTGSPGTATTAGRPRRRVSRR